MQVSYTPGPCKGDEAEFEGAVVLKAPTYEQRLEIAADPDLMEFLKDEEKAKGKKRDVKPQQLRTLIVMAKWSYQFYEKVDLKHRSTKVHFNDLDALKCDPRCAPIIQDVATKLASGFELGNS